MRFISYVLILLLIGAGITVAYSTYGAPSEFGNATTTTCYLGGDDGIVNCIGKGTFAFINISSHFKIETVNITCVISGCTWYFNATDSCQYYPSGGKDCGEA